MPLGDSTPQERAGSAYLKAVLAAIPDVVVILTPEGLVEDALCQEDNPDFRFAQRAKGRYLHDLFPPDNVALFLSVIHETLRGGRGIACEYAVQTKRGPRWFEARTSVLRGEGGRPDRVMWLPRDVGERRRDQDSLRKSEERLRALINAYPDMAFLLDTNDCVLAMNVGAEAQLAVAESEMRGRPIWERLDPVCVPRRQAVAQTVAETGLPVRFEDESYGRLLDISVFPVLDERRRISASAVYARDITKQRHLEQEKLAMEARMRHQQKLESIGTLASGVAHEINNPINIIMNYGELILDNVPAGSQVARYGVEIIAECERVAGIVRNLLDFSRQEKEHPRPVDLAPIIDSTLSLVREILRKNQITLVADYAPGLPPVMARPKQIMQVLMNLITNARDALNERYPGYDPEKRLRLFAVAIAREGRDWVRVGVEDHGIGIAPEVLERIFDPFFTTKSRAEGTGLGLSVSHGIVREHGGELFAESEPGSATRFFLDLPCVNAEGGAPT